MSDVATPTKPSGSGSKPSTPVTGTLGRYQWDASLLSPDPEERILIQRSPAKGAVAASVSSQEPESSGASFLLPEIPSSDLPLFYPAGRPLPQVPPGDLGSDLNFKTLFYPSKTPLSPHWMLRVMKFAFPSWAAVPASGFRYCLGSASTKSKVDKQDVEGAMSWMSIGPKPLLYLGYLGKELWGACTPWAMTLMKLTEGSKQVLARDGHAICFNRRKIPVEFQGILMV
jgi:hypothetical protein